MSQSRRRKGGVPIEALRQRYCPSTMQALRLMGITEHYVRGLGGLNMAAVSRELCKTASSKPTGTDISDLFDIMDGVMQFVDDVDRKKQKLLDEQGGPAAGSAVAEVCHI